MQYGGDFREAAERLAKGGPETYRAQKYTVDYVENLANRLGDVVTITCVTEEQYDVRLPSGVRAIGLGSTGDYSVVAVARLLEKLSPTMLILRSPMRRVLLWSAVRGVRTMLLLADSYNPSSVKSRVAFRLLAAMTYLPTVDLVANHGEASTRQLVEIGACASKCLAWDFPAMDTPQSRNPKELGPGPFRLIYVGAIVPEKGATDLIAAVRLMKDDGLKVSADIVGQGDEDPLRQMVNELGVADAVQLVGAVPNGEVINRMAQADVVVVPSRHAYAEGFPLTIYEAFCSRTPLVASDHPMFVRQLQHRESALLFRAGDPVDLAHRLQTLLTDSHTYATLSRNTLAAWQQLHRSVDWAKLIDTWLTGRGATERLLSERSCASASTANPDHDGWRNVRTSRGQRAP
ncbi:glycosyltransferase family 4 protein [Blastococcus sp. SYSU DS0828]